MAEGLNSTKRDVADVIDERPIGGFQVRVIVLCGLVSLLDGYDIQMMALVVPALAAEWGVQPKAFGTALAAVLAGIALGAAVLGPAGDRYGRRPVLIGSFLVVGVASLATTLSTSLTELAFWRLITGVGLGGSIPNAIALTSEYMPAKRRAALVTLMYCNISLGAFMAGFLAPALIDWGGWKLVFYVGGAVPLLLSVVLLGALPESVRLLLVRRPDDPRVARLTRKLVPENPSIVLTAAAAPTIRRSSVTEILAAPQTRGTLLLWATFVMNLFTLYLLVSWLPTILTGAGWTASQALRGAVMLQVGGIAGGLVLAWLIDKGRGVESLAAAYALTAVGFGLFTAMPPIPLYWWSLLVVVGAGTAGSQFALNALAAAYYAPSVRATGVGWALGVGRIGAVLSPFVGAALVAAGWTADAVLLLLALPVTGCAIGVLMLRRDLATERDGSPIPRARAATR